MPGHHGQTYDPNEEPPARGAWFRLADQPYPLRLDRAFRWGAILIAGAAGIGATWFLATFATRPPVDLTGWVVAIGLVLMAAAMAYGFTRGIGMIAVALLVAGRDVVETSVNWRNIRHDLRLRRPRVVALELLLLLAAAAGSFWGFILFARDGLLYGLAMCVLIQLMTYWPFVRRWILSGRSPRP